MQGKTNKDKGRKALATLTNKEENSGKDIAKNAETLENKPIKHRHKTLEKNLQAILENTDIYIYSEIAIELLKRYKIAYTARYLNTVISKNPTLKQLREENESKRLDYCESQLEKAIQDGNLTAIIFKLKTRGKSRGYTERAEITGADNQPIEYKWNIKKIE